MTMSLVRGMTSLNTKKRKATKMTAGRLEKLQSVQQQGHVFYIFLKNWVLLNLFS